MNIVEQLLYFAERDAELLENIRGRGDDPTVSREVDFCLATDDGERAETVCSFINDNRYGNARVETSDSSYRIITVAKVPLDPPIIHAMSANMVSVAHLFKVEYMGWGCPLQIPG